MPAITPLCTNEAVMTSIATCRKKDRTKVPLRFGPRSRLSQAKRKQPMTKHPIEVRERAQPYGLRF
jgi:hypothetical protein